MMTWAPCPHGVRTCGLEPATSANQNLESVVKTSHTNSGKWSFLRLLCPLEGGFRLCPVEECLRSAALSAESVSAKRHDSNVLAPGAQLGRCAFEMPHACIHHFCNGPKQQGQERCLKLLRGGCPRACENCKQLNLVCRCHGSSQIHLRPVHGRDTFGWLPPRPNRQRSSSAALLQEVVIPRAPGNMHSSLLWVRAVQTPLDLRETDSGEKDKDNPTTNKTKPTTAQTETPPPSGTAGSISSVLE